MLRYIKEDPLEVVICFPLGDNDGHLGVASPEDGASRGLRSSINMSTSADDVLGTTGGVLGDDDSDSEKDVLSASPAVQDSAVWLQSSMAGSTADFQALLSRTESQARQKIVRRGHRPQQRLVDCDSFLWTDGRQVSFALHKGTAVMMIASFSPRNGGVAESVEAHGRIALKRPIRKVPGQGVDGCVLSFSHFHTGVSKTAPKPLPASTPCTPTLVPVSFEQPDESDEYVVSSAVFKVVCLVPHAGDSSAFLVALFRCGYVGCLALTMDAETDRPVVTPLALSVRTPEAVGSKGPTALDIAPVPCSRLCVVITARPSERPALGNDEGPGIPSIATTLLVYDAPSATILFQRSIAVAGCVPCGLSCTSPVVTAQRPTSDGLEDRKRIFHVWIGGAERRALHRYAVALELGEADDSTLPPCWRAVSCEDLPNMQVNVEPSYFADCNVELVEENPLATADIGSTTTALSSDAVEVIGATWDAGVALGRRSGRVGSATPSHLALCALLAHQSPVSVQLCCGLQSQVAGKGGRSGGCTYDGEGVVLVLWPQCLMLVDPNYCEGANVIGVVAHRTENVFFTGCWITLHAAQPVVHLAQDDGVVLSYRLYRRSDAPAKAQGASTSFPLDHIDLVSELSTDCTFAIPWKGRPDGATAAVCSLTGVNVLPDGVLSSSDHAEATATVEGAVGWTTAVAHKPIKVVEPRASCRMHGTSLRIVDVPQHAQMLLAVSSSGQVSYAPLGGGRGDYSILRQVSPDMHGRALSTAPIASAVLLNHDDGASLLLVTGHRDGTVEVWQEAECLWSLSALHNGPVESIQEPVQGGSLFLKEHVGFLSIAPTGGTVVLHSKKDRHFAPLRRLSAPQESLSSILWDTATDLVILEGRSTGAANLWFAHTGKLERTVHEPTVNDVATAARISLVHVPLCTPLATSATQAAACVCEYTNVSFVGRNTNVLQTALTPLIARVHAEVTAFSQCAERDRYRTDSAGGASPLRNGSAPFSPRVALALFHCFSIPDATGCTPPCSPATADQSEGPFTRLSAKLQLPRNVYPPPRRLHVERLLRRSGAQTTRIFILLLSLLKVVEPLAGRELTEACVTFLLDHIGGNPSPLRSTSPLTTSASSFMAPLVLPCVATCVPYVLHPLIAVQDAAHATMAAVVQRLSASATIDLLCEQASSPVTSVPPPTSGHRGVTAVDQRCLGRVVLALHASKQFASREDAALQQVIHDVVAELPAFLLAWATQAEPPAGTAAACSQPIVLSVFADAWLTWQSMLPNNGDDVIDLVFARCVAHTTSCPEYRYNHGARALVDIAGRNFSRFIGCVERWFARVEWRTPLLQLLTRVTQKYPAAMLSAFPTAVLHFAWMALDPHAPHRSARDQWVGAVSHLLRASVHVLPNVAFHQALQHLVVGHDDGQVFVYDVKSTRVLCCFQSHSASIACVAFHAGSTQDIAVVSAALDVVRFWRMGRAHSIMGLLSMGGTTCHVSGAVDVPVTRAMRRDLDALPNKCMTPDMIASSCRLSWLSPSCVELQTPWHDRIQLMVQ